MKKIFVLLYLVSSTMYPSFASASHTPDAYPRLANYFLKWQLTESEARELAKWDLVILDAETQVAAAPLLKKMREWNPRITLLAYITSQEIRKDAGWSGSIIRQKLAAGVQPEWYLTDASGDRLSWWQGTYLLDMRNRAMDQYLAGFVAKEIIGTGLWDGIFYDNAWDSITYFVPGKFTAEADGQWQSGMKFLYNETRRLSGRPIILVGNGTTRAYQHELNGNMIENFLPGAWTPTMRTYAFDASRRQEKIVNIVNANTGNRGFQNRYREMRFGLASTLLHDGYYSFDFGDRDHAQLWWYDEYSVDLGASAGAAVSAIGRSAYDADVWRREFDHGAVIVNATPERRTLELAGEYEKIHGLQDPATNNGAILSSVSVPGFDGVLLLKSLSSLGDVVYENGAFARFMRGDGSRARNGFFAFDAGGSGGDAVARADLDGNGTTDFVRASKGKLLVERHDHQPFASLYPYTANFRGRLSLALLSGGDKEKNILVAPANGVQPVRLYTRHGERVGADWWPFGARYGGGIRAAGIPGGGIVFAKGYGQEPIVALFDKDRNLIRQWLAYEKNFRGGIAVAAGDVMGDGATEIIVASGAGRTPSIKIFDLSGKELSSFTPGGDAVIGIAAEDVDFDGKNEIVVLSS